MNYKIIILIAIVFVLFLFSLILFLFLGSCNNESFTSVGKSIKLLSVGTDPKKAKLWEDSARKFGWDYEVVGKNQKWPSSKYGKALGKFKFLIPALKKVKSEYILITDAYDVILNDTPDEALKQYFNKVPDGSKILIGEEPSIAYVDESLFPNITTINGRNINTGHIMGKTKDILNFFNDLQTFKKDCSNDICSDQRLLGKMHCDSNFNWEIDKNIITDSDNDLFYIYYANNSPIVEYKNNHFYFNKKKPLLLHCVASDEDNMTQYYYINGMGFKHFNNQFYGNKCNYDCPICGHHWLYTLITRPHKWYPQVRSLILQKFSN